MLCAWHCIRQAYRQTGGSQAACRLAGEEEEGLDRVCNTSSFDCKGVVCMQMTHRQTDRQTDRLTRLLADEIVTGSAQAQIGDSLPADAQTDSQQTLLIKKMMRWMMYAWMMF